MKGIALSISRLLLVLLLLFFACDRSTVPNFKHEEGESLRTIAYLKSLARGTSTPITEDIRIEGIVVGNDLFGEFYKTLIINDKSGGITLSIDAARLADSFPIGLPVTLYCQGLVLGDYGGKIELGTMPAAGDDYAVGRIAADDLPKYLQRRDVAGAQQPQPDTITFAEVGEYQMDRFVCFERVHFADADGHTAWCDVDSLGQPLATERTLLNATGQQFTVRTVASCTYAAESLPPGVGTVAGIIDYFNDKYTLRITDRRIFFPQSQ